MTQAKNPEAVATNSGSNDAPFTIEASCGHSMCRLHRKLLISSLAAHCVATAHVSRHAAHLVKQDLQIGIMLKPHKL